MQIPPMDSLCRDHSFEPLNVPFAPFLSYLPHTFTPGRNFGPLTPSQNHSGYRRAIVKRIPRLDSPPQDHSLETLNVPFEPFSRSLIHTFTLGRIFESLTLSMNYSGYRHAIVKRRPGLDSPPRDHSLETLNVPFAPFSRLLIHTFTLGWIFESLTISQNYSGYRHAIVKWIPGLDSPPQGHSLEALNVPFAPFSRSLIHTFTLERIFLPLTISQNYSGYRHAIVKRIPGLDSPHREHSLEPPNVPFRTISSSGTLALLYL